MQQKCVHCGRQVMFLDGAWHHVWRIKVGEGQGVGGARMCSWREAPGEVETYAEPAGVQGRAS